MTSRRTRVQTKEDDMNPLDTLADRYIATWNETDPTRRLELIKATYTEGAIYTDPLNTGREHAGIDAMIQAAQVKYPGHRFRRTTNLDVHNDRVRFSWEMAPEHGPILAKGTDICTLENGRFQSVLGFMDEVQGQALVVAIPNGATSS
jgi:hypothetical protein